MEALRKIAGIINDNCVQEPSNQRLGSQKCDLLVRQMLQDFQRLVRLPHASSLPEGGLGYLQVVTVQDDGSGGLAGCDVYGCGPLESQSGEIRMDHEIIMNWDDVLRKSHFIPRKRFPITSFWRRSFATLTPGRG